MSEGWWYDYVGKYLSVGKRTPAKFNVIFTRFVCDLYFSVVVIKETIWEAFSRSCQLSGEKGIDKKGTCNLESYYVV